MNIVFVASEAVPFIKTGGLADVVGTLSGALASLGESVTVIIPKYSMISQTYRKQMQHVTDFHVTMGWRRQYVGVEKLTHNGVTFLFADNEYYFKQDYVYCDGNFEAERFCWFARAAMEMMCRLDIVPDILHLHDWQAGLLAMLLKNQYNGDRRWHRTKTLFTIHNLRYQGLMNLFLVNDMLGVGQKALECAEYYSNINALKAGIVCSDKVSTVSPTYAAEIKTPVYGETLDGLLRNYDVRGIMNGIDTVSFDPAVDKALPFNYSSDDIKPKRKCKLNFQREVGLIEDASKPLIAVISRLTNQKGLDIMEQALPGIMDLGAQMIVLGMGDSHYEYVFSQYQQMRKGQFAFRCEMNDALARRIYAASDMFLMPSAFEPCGLSQLFALRYGSVPIVRETGGLADSIKPYNKFTLEGNGFSFGNYSAHELYNTVKTAVELYRFDEKEWLRLTRAAMLCDFSWQKSAELYLNLYAEMLE